MLELLAIIVLLLILPWAALTFIGIMTVIFYRPPLPRFYPIQPLPKVAVETLPDELPQECLPLQPFDAETQQTSQRG